MIKPLISLLIHGDPHIISRISNPSAARPQLPGQLRPASRLVHNVPSHWESETRVAFAANLQGGSKQMGIDHSTNILWGAIFRKTMIFCGFWCHRHPHFWRKPNKPHTGLSPVQGLNCTGTARCIDKLLFFKRKMGQDSIHVFQKNRSQPSFFDASPPKIAQHLQFWWWFGPQKQARALGTAGSTPPLPGARRWRVPWGQNLGILKVSSMKLRGYHPIYRGLIRDLSHHSVCWIRVLKQTCVDDDDDDVTPKEVVVPGRITVWTLRGCGVFFFALGSVYRVWAAGRSVAWHGHLGQMYCLLCISHIHI